MWSYTSCSHFRIVLAWQFSSRVTYRRGCIRRKFCFHLLARSWHVWRLELTTAVCVLYTSIERLRTSVFFFFFIFNLLYRVLYTNPRKVGATSIKERPCRKILYAFVTSLSDVVLLKLLFTSCLEHNPNSQLLQLWISEIWRKKKQI